MTILNAIILGLLQGLTEFLPISSSGHLILARTYLGLSENGGLAFDASIGLGTTAALIVYFFPDLWRLLGSFFRMLARKPLANPNDKPLIWAIIAGTIPVVLAGFAFNHYIENNFRSPILVAIGLLVGSLVLILAERTLRKTTVFKTGAPTLGQSVMIGIFQAIALIPGMSRSGMTISAGMFSKFSRTDAARFAFLLSVPVTLGAGGLEFMKILHSASGSIDLMPVLVGTIVSFLSGLAAIWGLLAIVRRYTLTPFIIYRVLLALVVIAVSLN